MPPRKRARSGAASGASKDHDQKKTSLVQEDRIHEEISNAFLGSFAVDIRCIDRNNPNRITGILTMEDRLLNN